MKYNPNGGTLHDLAAVATQWVVAHPSLVLNRWDMFETVFRSAQSEYRKRHVDINDVAVALLAQGINHFDRPNIQKAMDELERWFK